MMPNLKETKEFLESKLPGFKPEVALIVGSGLGGVASAVTKPITIPYADIPNFPKATVAGHAGQMVCGELAGKRVLVLSGRFHLYEGRSLEEVVFPVHVVDTLGVKVLPVFNPGDLMLIEDHINHLGVNPLIEFRENDAVKFLDMTQAYSSRLREKLETAAEKAQILLRRGVYLATTGPSYETPAEVKTFAWWGADAVGMSTVPEAVAARQCGLNVAAVSCVTNLAAGSGRHKLSHAEVLETGEKVKTLAAKLLKSFSKLYGDQQK